jgi:hypothetical protein
MTASTAVMGWFIWNTMRALAALGLTLLATSVVLAVWFMFKVGLAWVAILVIVLALVLALLTLRALYRQRRPAR